MTHPNLKALALAAVEAEKAYYAKPSSEAADAASRARNKVKGAATPERILQYRDEVLEEARQALRHCLFDAPTHAQEEALQLADFAIRSLKSKEPSP